MGNTWAQRASGTLQHSTDNTDSIENTIITDPYGEPIEYDGNPAHAEGYLASIGEYLMDHGEFVPLFEHNAALLY